jgi:orotate phosphoribosyltransferase
VNYRSFQHLNLSIVRNLHKLPKDVDLVVGVPRSGLLAANLLALHLNLPLADLDGFKAKRLLRGGARTERVKVDFDGIRNVIVLDDSLQSGHAMKVARETLENLDFDKKLHFGVVYLKPGAQQPIDFHLEECAMPRAFEWNMMHHSGVLIHSAMEIDGVLCHGPERKDLVSPDRYAEFITNARPNLRFTGKIGLLVTNRPESHRRETEAWLAGQGIDYGRLIMSEATRGSRDWKPEIYGSDRDLFVFFVGNVNDAKRLACRTGKMVYAADVREMIYPSGAVGSLRAARRKLVSLVGGAMPGSMKLAIKQFLEGGSSGSAAYRD